MCGVAGIFSTVDRVPRHLTTKIQRVLAHRGPDDAGVFERLEIVMVHTRLSVVDLSPMGHQPMHSPCGRYVLSYNGEIYNHPELRAVLQSKGYLFRGTSDTETLLAAYLEWGEKVWIRLNGIFALALYDTEKRTLTLVRDRFGVKPLYYSFVGGRLLFGSEIKALLATGYVEPQIDVRSLHEFMYYGYAMAERTMYRGVYKLLPGQWLKIDGQGGIRTGFYWRVDRDVQVRRSVGVKEAVAQVRTHLRAAVRRQLMSDVPVGVFLSGGIDSTAVAVLASREYHGLLQTFTASFDFDEGRSELATAARTAKQIGSRHMEIYIQGKSLIPVIETLVRHHDEPFSDAANIPLYLMSAELKGRVKVVLQGDGGDEMFGGYRRYAMLRYTRWWRKLFRFLHYLRWLSPYDKRRKVERFKAIFEAQRGRMYAKLLTEEREEESPLRVFRPEWRRAMEQYNPFGYYEELYERIAWLRDPSQIMLWIDAQILLPFQFLEKVDKSTMANGIEARVPMLDHDLAEYAMSLPSSVKLRWGRTKYLLREALRGIVDDAVLDAPKKGFGVPYKQWLRGPLYAYLRQRLFDSRLRDVLYDQSAIERVVHQHRAGKVDYGFLLWKLLHLTLWMEEYRVRL